jgi:hypothetical protein
MSAEVIRAARWFVLAGALVLLTRPAAADIIVSDQLIVHGPDVDIDLTVDESQEHDTFVHTSLNVISDNYGLPTVLLEPNGSISDVVGVEPAVNEQHGAFLGFVSDLDGQSFDLQAVLNSYFGGVPAGSLLPGKLETAAGFDLSLYLAKGYTGTFFSDVETPDTPEPSAAIGLAGLGAMGLVGLVWRRRQTSRCDRSILTRRRTELLVRPLAGCSKSRP